MIDYTSQYAGCNEMTRQNIARTMLDDDQSLLHIVIDYNDSHGVEIPTFLIFDDQGEWDAWVSLYQYTGGHVTACHTRNPIY